ncbi:phenylalanine--tRNA ligase subunit beta [Gaopeijia maritima]|uniref:Phenylalanine--tRNA ligase beta subunit n=1 Tax=Gaopeijia maritima TaxID=3119007 RepID=A0ABU9E6N4_9BACT
MNVSLGWLRALAPGVESDPEALSERLAALGFPVEGAVAHGALLGDIVVGRVVEAGQHPNADRLSLCKVDAGGDELLSVVCGAPNVRAGGIYPFIPVGGVLPGGMKIRKAKIRGERSFGMLCSAKELGLGADHSGILELRTDAPAGTPFLEVYGLRGDACLDVEVTANRGDLLSHVGIAREVAPEGVEGISLPTVPGGGAPEFELRSDAAEVDVDGVTVSIREPELCGRFLGAVVRGVKVGPSPDWLQARLRSIGARPINNVVDATNYVLFELGQPTHAYDLSQLRGNAVITRLADEGESVRTLDEVDRTLTSSMLVIADAERVVDVAGIMGEDSSSVSEGTVDLFVECAHFEPRSIRTTKKALGIQSDAGYRFERFVDPAGQERALRRVLEIILATAGGTLHPVVADVHPRPWVAPVIELRRARVGRLLGVDFDSGAIAALLRPLGFEVDEADGETLRVTVPGWRGYDVTREVDLIEEVARRYGFDRFPEVAGPHRSTTVPDHPLFGLEDALRDFLTGTGLFEAQTPAFVPESEGEVRLSNPLAQTEPVLRRDLVPSLLRRVEYNLARGVRDVRLFEIATSFRVRGAGEAPSEETRLAAVLTGRRAPEHWSGDDPAIDLRDLQGLLDGVLRRARPGARPVPGEVEGSRLRAGRGWVIVEGERTVGFAGLVDPAHLDLPPWAGDVLAFELTLPDAPAPTPTPVARPLPAYPAAERDVALIVPRTVEASRLVEVARDAGGAELEAVEIVDLYEGERLPEGTRSIAYRFRFRSLERTLTDDEVERAFRSIVDRVEEEPGVHIRR